jgi:ParB family chromosome partitioning protein
MKIENTGKRQRRKNLFAGETESSSIEVETITIDSIEIVSNPRTDKGFDKDSIDELARAIESVGLLQPITVRKRGNSYELIAGERRLRAFKKLKRKSIPAIVLDSDALDPEKHALARIIENLQRVDLAPGELALAIQALVEQSQKQADIAKELGKSKTWVSRKIKHAELINEYPEAVKLETSKAVEIAAGEQIAESIQASLNNDLSREKLRRRNSEKKDPPPKPEPKSKLEKLQAELKNTQKEIKRLKDLEQHLMKRIESMKQAGKK